MYKWILLLIIMCVPSITYGQNQPKTVIQDVQERLDTLEKENIKLLNIIGELRRSVVFAEHGVNYLFQKSPEYKAACERGILNWSIVSQEALDRAREEVARFDNKKRGCSNDNKPKKYLVTFDINGYKPTMEYTEGKSEIGLNNDGGEYFTLYGFPIKGERGWQTNGKNLKIYIEEIKE